MRKSLTFSASACLLALGLTTGCGNQSNSAQVAEQLEELLDQMSVLDAPEAGFETNSRLYSNGTTVEGVTIQGEISNEAAYVDQAVALLPLAKQIAANGNERQKQAANAIIASILADEAAYLISVAQQDYESAALQISGKLVSIDPDKYENAPEQDLISGLFPQINTLREIDELSQKLSGDRAIIIDTIKTGQAAGGTKVTGIDQHRENASSAEQAEQQARAELAKVNKRIEALREEVAEYESVELKLSNEALGAQGATKYQKLDQATSAAYEAQSAEAKADSLLIDQDIQSNTAELAEGRKTRATQTADALQDKIDKVEAEKETVAGKLAQLDTNRKTMIQTLTKAFNRIDTQMKVRGFDRMAKAQRLLNDASEALGRVSGSSIDIERLGVDLLRARSLQQQTLAARSYAGLLDSLAAAGPERLSPELYAAITGRSEDMKQKLADLSDDAVELKQQADATLSTIKGNVDGATDQGKAMLAKTDLFESLLKPVE